MRCKQNFMNNLKEFVAYIYKCFYDFKCEMLPDNAHFIDLFSFRILWLQKLTH